MIPAASLQRGLPKHARRFYVIGGAEDFLAGEAKEAILASLDDEVEILEHSAVSDTFELRDVLDELRSQSLFGGPRVVILERADKLLDAVKKTLIRALAELPDQVPLILTGEGLVPKGRKAGPSGVAKAVAEAGGLVIRCDAPYDSSFGNRGPAWKSPLTDWVVARSRVHGLELRPEVAFRLHRLVGTKLRELDAEMRKLALATGGGAITEELLERHVGSGRLVPLFDAADALLARDLPRTLALVGALFERGYQDASGRVILDSNGVAAALCAVIRRRVAALWRGAEALDRGVRIGEVAKLVGIPPFQADRLGAEIDAWVRGGDLEGVREGLLELERGLKSARPPRLAFESFVISSLRSSAGSRR